MKQNWNQWMEVGPVISLTLIVVDHLTGLTPLSSPDLHKPVHTSGMYTYHKNFMDPQNFKYVSVIKSYDFVFKSVHIFVLLGCQ